MKSVISPMEAVRGHDLGDVCDLIWANAADAAPRWSAKPEPQSSVRLGPAGDHRLSRERGK